MGHGLRHPGGAKQVRSRCAAGSHGLSRLVLAYRALARLQALCCRVPQRAWHSGGRGSDGVLLSRAGVFDRGRVRARVLSQQGVSLSGCGCAGGGDPSTPPLGHAAAWCSATHLPLQWGPASAGAAGKWLGRLAAVESSSVAMGGRAAAARSRAGLPSTAVRWPRTRWASGWSSTMTPSGPPFTTARAPGRACRARRWHGRPPVDLLLLVCSAPSPAARWRRPGVLAGRDDFGGQARLFSSPSSFVGKASRTCTNGVRHPTVWSVSGRWRLR